MKEIKYVIWGAGRYGQRAINAIGGEHVEAFVDSDSQKVGTVYCYKNVISLKQYISEYSKCILLIANTEFAECCEILKQYDIQTYLLYQNIPSELFCCIGYWELKQYVLNMINEDDLYGIQGLGLYSLTVYYWIKEKNQRAKLIINRNTSKQMLLLLDSYSVSYTFDDAEEVGMMDVVFLCDYISRHELSSLLLECKQYCYIFDCADKIEAYYHPKLESFKNIHKKARCFLVATGSSLMMEDLDLLKKSNEICFSMNSIFKAFDKTKWRPDYYVVSDRQFASENRKIIDSLNISYKFVADQCDEFWKYEHEDSVMVYHIGASDCCYDFSEDISRVSYAGYTVAYVCLQMAVYMGFKEIYMLGTDCNYNKGSKNNHFMEEMKPDYTNHNEDKMLLAYQAAKQYADTHGIKIYNATRGGMLEVFERVDFDSLFE